MEGIRASASTSEKFDCDALISLGVLGPFDPTFISRGPARVGMRVRSSYTPDPRSMTFMLARKRRGLPPLSAERIRGERMDIAEFWRKRELIDGQFDEVCEAVVNSAFGQMQAANIVRALFMSKRDAIISMFRGIFWLIYSSVCSQSEMIGEEPRTGNIAGMRRRISRQWAGLRFEVIEHPAMAKFVEAVPFVYAQIVHHMFVVLSRAHPTTMAPDFRRRICAAAVNLFTGVDHRETYLREGFRRYFARPPQVDASFTEAKLMVPKSVLLPVEDLSTLIEMPRRAPSRRDKFGLGALSKLIAESQGPTAVPPSRRTGMTVLRPASEADWTTNLGKLIPRPRGIAGVYDPRLESRSLVARSRRPVLARETVDLRAEYEKVEAQRVGQWRRSRRELRVVAANARGREPPVVRRFTEDVRMLQVERKWSELPRWRSPEEVAEGERQKAWRARGIAEMEAERRLRRKRGPGLLLRFLPWQLVEEPEEVRRQLGMEPGEPFDWVDVSPRRQPNIKRLSSASILVEE